MHIPDGYLSPSTCAGLYAAATPFWYIGFRRVQKALTSRAVPLISVFSSFSFVIMTFNLPLPGGTTGHAVGMGMAAIVLGPWISVLAISTALLIQALLFGDGGITSFGANSFNMAIVGSLVAYAVYRLVARNAPLTSARRVIAAGLAGYIAINLAAFCAAVEFGIQPLFFRDAAGVPLYAPYPLNISIPAMMIGHLTIAGMAELVFSAGLVAYLQRADPGLLRHTAPYAPDGYAPSSLPLVWPSARKLWLIVGVLLVLTPLGIFATGSAWGEWHAKDFANPESRANITNASGQQAPPERVPSGLAHISAFWKAPVSGYAPVFTRSVHFGYFLAAGLGVGVIILFTVFVGLILKKFRGTPRVKAGFLEKTIDSLLRLSEEELLAENVARSAGLLQRLDPRVKLAGFASLILAVIAVHRLWLLVALFLFSVLLVRLSKIRLLTLFTRVWISVLGFTGIIALPALFVTQGQTAVSLPLIPWPVTWQGLSTAAFLVLRAETAATLAFAAILTTPWHRLLRALRLFRIPASAVVVLETTYRYIFVFLRMAHHLFESRRARLLGPLEETAQRASVAAIAGALLEKSFSLSSEVHLAMQARGFRGEARLLDNVAMRGADWFQLAAFVATATLAVWVGR
jgi:cobalt/nickel transport system permease protein